MNSKPLASLSLDLDNKWSYLKTHGDPGWDTLPTYLPLVVPRILDMLRDLHLTISFFIVGQDAEREENHAPLRAIAEAGHEIGNHSFHHEPWLHLYAEAEIEAELVRTEEALEKTTGQHPVGFRGPGFSISSTVLEVLARRGYEYDASTFPTFLGPLARAYYFRSARLSPEERVQRELLFGAFSEGFRPLRPYKWPTASRPITEIPVTTMPLFKVPIHVSYLLYLGAISPGLAQAYFRGALTLCALLNVQPSLLLHPLDFLGAEDESDLAFFPAMSMPTVRKLRIVGDALDLYSRQFRVVTVREHARSSGSNQGNQGTRELCSVCS